MNERLCPITGELLPVTDPGRIVSQTAINRFKTATSDLVGLMEIIDELIAGAGKKHDGGGGRVSGPRAPLNLGLLDAVEDWRNTIDVWAHELLTYARPGVNRTPGDWQAAMAIFQQYGPKCSHWTQQWRGETQPTGAMCIDEVMEAIRRLEAIANPREPRTIELDPSEAVTALEGVTLTIRSACEAVRLVTGKELPTATVRKWEQRGKIHSEGNPRRYPIDQLLQLAVEPT